MSNSRNPTPIALDSFQLIFARAPSETMVFGRVPIQTASFARVLHGFFLTLPTKPNISNRSWGYEVTNEIDITRKVLCRRFSLYLRFLSKHRQTYRLTGEVISLEAFLKFFSSIFYSPCNLLIEKMIP